MSDMADIDNELGFAESLSRRYSLEGEAVVVEELKKRLSPALYEQLSDGSDSNAMGASRRAVIHAGAIAARVGKSLDLNDTVTREIVLNLTIYELHLALGHEEAGREYRLKARDLMNATFELDQGSGGPSSSGGPALGSVVKPAPPSGRRLW